MRQTYEDMLQNWLFPLMEVDANEFIFQQDMAPPY